MNTTIIVGHPEGPAGLRTSAECLAKAAQMQDQAAQCGDADMRDRFQYLATHWRSLADQAVYQDTMGRRLNDNDSELK